MATIEISLDLTKLYNKLSEIACKNEPLSAHDKYQLAHAANIIKNLDNMEEESRQQRDKALEKFKEQMLNSTDPPLKTYSNALLELLMGIGKSNSSQTGRT